MSTPHHPRKSWTRDELLLAFRLYCRTPFGKLHQHNPDIIALAKLLGRTPSAVGMKACNFASLDPVHRTRGIKALGNLSNADRELWRAFEEDSEAIAAETEEAFERVGSQRAGSEESDLTIPDGETEIERVVRARRVQSFFRTAVLSSYECRCAISGLAIPELLVASHIIPWSACVERRADSRNGLCLNALYDRAFDRGLITLDACLRVIVSTKLRDGASTSPQTKAMLKIEGMAIQTPVRFAPDLQAVEYHRTRIYVA